MVILFEADRLQSLLQTRLNGSQSTDSCPYYRHPRHPGGNKKNFFIMILLLVLLLLLLLLLRYQDNIPPDNIPPDNIPRTISPRTISPQDKIPPDNIPPFQYPPGQYPPGFFFFNSSVLNYPKLCAGKKIQLKKNCSVLNYSKKIFQKLKFFF